MLKLSGIKQDLITPAISNKYLRLQRGGAFFKAAITKKNMVVCVITGQVKRQAVHGKCVFDGSPAAAPPGFGLVRC